MAELYWRSLMTLLYWEWHLIPRWPLRSTFARFLEQLLKDLVSWGSLGECSMIDRFLGDAFGVLSCQFWSTVLQSGARLPIHTFKLLDRAVSSAQFLTGGVFKCDIAHCRSVAVLCICFIRSGVTRCTLLMVLYLDHMCQCGLHAVLWSHIGTLMHRLAAEPRSTAELLFPSRCPSGTILLTPYSLVWDWRVSRAGPMLLYWPKLLYPYYSLLLFFPFCSFCL